MDNKTKVVVNSGMGWMVIFLACLFFWGEPDLYDAIIIYLTK